MYEQGVTKIWYDMDIYQNKMVPVFFFKQGNDVDWISCKRNNTLHQKKHRASDVRQNYKRELRTRNKEKIM